MSPGQKIQAGKPYLKIIGGSICQTVDKNTQGARHREYELSNGEKGEKWEIVYSDWIGKIIGIEVKEGNYGETCNIEFEDAILSLSTSSRYFQDLACKLFSGDLKKEFKFHPYDFETETGRKTGVSLQQDGEKLKNYFWDGKEELHGFPKVNEEKKVKKSYWKVYFTEVADFLTEKLQKLEFEAPIKEELTQPPAPDEDVAEDLPF